MPHLIGLDEGRHLPSASSLCGACGEVCPVKIPIPDLLVRLRQESVDGDKLHPAKVRGHGAKRSSMEAMIWKGWAWMHASPGIYRFGTGAASKFRALQPSKAGAWTDYRTPPKLAAKTLHQRMKERGQ